MKKPQFVEEEIYHIYNRGVEKRNIFLDEKDYYRFIHDLFEMNNKNSSPKFGTQSSEVQPPMIEQSPMIKPIIRRPRKLLVEILIFTLMPNHFHLLLRQKVEKGIVRFMQKLGTGYTMYFNQRYDRVGGLFQGRFKAVLIKEEPHFIYLPYYIHINPLELANFGGSTSEIWREKMEFLKKYKWSSFRDYIGEKNFPSLTSRDFLLNFFKGEKNYKKDMEEFLKGKGNNFSVIKDIALENILKND